MSPIELLGLIAGGIGVFYGLPQALHVRRIGHGAGVSLTAWAVMFAVTASWASYGIRIGAASVVITNVLSTLVNGSVVVALVGRVARAVVALAALWAALMVFALFAPEFIVSAVLVLLMFGQVPQARASLQNFRARRTSAVSLRALQVSLTSLVCWETYAIVTDTKVMIVTTSLALAMNGSILVLEVLARRAHAERVVIAEA